MKTEYKYIRFEKSMSTWLEGWLCLNKKEGYQLGSITYHKRWKEWEFNPSDNTSFTIVCLRDIADFIDQLNREAKQ